MSDKLSIKKYAAIDIGSNAMRLLIAMVVNDSMNTTIKKVSLVRLPVRLGQDAFTKKALSEKTITKFLDGMKAFQIIMDIHGIEDYMAVATSAMREANNGVNINKLVKNLTGIEIAIIDGKKEAEIIFKAHFKNSVYEDCNYIYVDVGGGSTEVTILSGSNIIASKSFKIGTIRMMNNMVVKERWTELKDWVKSETKSLEHIEMIGSGGNINRIYKLMDVEFPKPVLYQDFKKMKETLGKMSIDQRITEFKLNPDRADVIVHASEIYFSIMKWADSSILHVPRIGLSDGIIQLLHEKHIKSVPQK
jgi:exopolyphosphatase/guanosine-5'-triphosphate,3'-diphosphate pyrophosphatase